jgi:hypothetical protein
VVKTCANPACAAPFLYWRGGKLFRFLVKAPYETCLDVPENICELKPSRSSVYFWLCKKCCSTMVLNFDPHKGLTVPPRRSGKRDRSLTGLKDARRLNAPPLLSGGQASSIGMSCDPIEGGR